MEPTEREIQKSGKKKWEVDFGIDENGVRRRPYFATEADAEAAIDNYEKDLKKGGEFWAECLPRRVRKPFLSWKKSRQQT